MTKEAGFLDTIIKNPKTVLATQTTSSNNEVKVAPSLFDSMLESATSKQNSSISNEKVLSTEQNKASEMPKEISSSTSETIKTSDTSSTEAVKNNNNTTASSSSFLDKLAQETSQENKEQKSNSATTKTAVEVQNNGQVTQEKNQSALNESIKTNQTTTLDTKNMSESNKSEPTMSLLDKLVKEANLQIKNESQIVSDVKTQPEDGLKIESNVKENNSVSQVSDSVKIVAEATQANQQNNPAKVVLPNETPLPNGTQTTTAQQGVETTSSLLDKLLQEANTQIQNESAKNSTVTNTTEVEIVKTTQVKEVASKETTASAEQKTTVQTEEIIIKESVKNDSKVVTVQTQVVKENIVVNPNTVNEKVASELAKISQNGNEKVNISKEELLAEKPQNETIKNSETQAPKSLMDRMLDENKINKVVQENTLNNKTILDSTSGKLPTDALLNNIYFSSLTKASKDAFLEKNFEVKTLVANATSVKEVKQGAELLNLGLQSSEVIVEEEQFKENVKNEFLNKLSINRDIIKHDISKMNEELASQSKLIKNESIATATSSLLSSASLPEVEVTVSSSTAYNIENRIIGARQHMNSMMSDMARNMYLNYKPPVTAFRMNLNPGTLGSIAVLIKNDKESGLSISLNMSNAATLDSFVDNQAALRAALAKNFNTNTNINLEFNMQDGQQKGNGNQQNKKQQQQNHQATNDILESLNNNEANNKVTNYM